MSRGSSSSARIGRLPKLCRQASFAVNDATQDMTKMVRQPTKLQQESRLKDESKGTTDKSKETGTATTEEWLQRMNI
jgi:hypothetical protein